MGVFEIISLLLKLVGLWEGFLDFIDKKHTAEMEVRRQNRLAAIDELGKAESDEDIFKAQEKIVDNKP